MSSKKTNSKRKDKSVKSKSKTNSKEKVRSLNESDSELDLECNIKPESYFYFDVGFESNKKTYSINRKHIALIPLFKTMSAKNPYDSNSPLTAVHINPVYIRDDCKKNNEFWVNTIELFDVIMEYVDIWKDDIDSENYIKQDIVQTGYANQIIKEKDLELILKFADSKLEQLDDETKNSYEDNLTLRKYHTISQLNPLLKTIDGFLQMDGFANKIYAYIATIIWNCSLMDLYEVSEDTYFKELQQQHIDEWNKQTNEQISYIAEGEDEVGEDEVGEDSDSHIIITHDR